MIGVESESLAHKKNNLVQCQGAQRFSMKGVLILFVTAIVVCVRNRTQGFHRHKHGKTGHKPERDTGSITLKPGTAMNKLFSGCRTNFRYICHATGMEEQPKVTLDIQCLWRGGGVALTLTINYFLHQEVMAAHGL